MCSREKWKNTPKPIRIIVYSILGILGVCAMGIIFGLGIMWLWNWLMPAIFGLGEITYWQAIGIFILAKLIFGGVFRGEKEESKSKKARTARWEEYRSGSYWTEYESWWETEGKKSFEKYKSDKETETPDQNNE